MNRCTWLGAAIFIVLVPFGARAAPADPDVRIDARADEQVRRMSEYLSRLRSFRLHTRASEDHVATDGQKIQFLIEQDVQVKRPNQLRADRRDPNVDAVLRVDNGKASVFGKRTGYYAIADTKPNLNDAIDDLRGRYGIDAPAADLLVGDPYSALMEDVTVGRYVGLESIGGVSVHHLAFQGREVDWQIWIADGAQPLPLRYAITSKLQASSPQFTIDLSNWEPNATIDSAAFAFTPPPGAQRIAFAPVRHTRTGR
jgi:hypothetical protein